MKLNTILLLTIIALLLFITACQKQETIGIPNPASENCINLGGTLEFRENENGQYGVCIKNNKECEEWALFRNECSLDMTSNEQGLSFQECKQQGGLIIGINNDQCTINNKVFIKESNKIINLEECDAYYDGCNTCMISNNKIMGCTEMYCENPKTPKCLKQEETNKNLEENNNQEETNNNNEERDFTNSFLKDQCKKNNGTWINEQKECEYISQETCNEFQGTFNECGSACRNNPESVACTMQCVPYCKLDSQTRKNNCESQDGEFKKMGMAQIEQCNLKTTDFNTPCQDSSECEGMY
jgi:putative hemolysin